MSTFASDLATVSALYPRGIEIPYTEDMRDVVPFIEMLFSDDEAWEVLFSDEDRLEMHRAVYGNKPSRPGRVSERQVAMAL